MRSYIVGGMADHVHILLEIPVSRAVADAMRILKSGSSRFVHEDCHLPEFAWQQGYGAFTVSHSQVETTYAYIAHQKEHHRKRDFQAEYLALLQKHQIAYDPQYLWN